MKRLLIFLPTIGYGGAEISLTRIAGYLSENNNIKVDLLVAKKLDKSLEIDISSQLNITYLGSKKTILSLFKLLKFIRASRPDVILSTLPTPNILLITLKQLRLIKSRVVIREANSNYLYWKKGLLNKIKGSIAVFAFNKSDANIFISQELQTNLERYISNKQNTTIYNPVFSHNFFEKSTEQVKNFKIPNVELWVTTSRLEHQKGLDIFFEASYSFLEKRNFSILVVGDGSLESFYKKKYADLPITFIGNTENPLKYLKLADIFFFPSRREGLGNSLIEAQILGKNIISSDCPSGPKEIIEIFNNGTLFKSENINDLIEAIESIELKEDRDVSKEIVDKFSVEKVSEQYFQLLNNLI